MRRFSVLLVVLAATCSAARAQETSGGILFSRYPQFRIPYSTNVDNQRLKQLRLFVSSDQGRTWQPSATAAPDQKFFRFITDRDGYYWFTVQTLDVDGNTFPASLASAQPSLKVVVDTHEPVVSLDPMLPREGQVGVRWKVGDENIDLALSDALRLEYRVTGSTIWLPLTLPVGVQQHYWNPQTDQTIEVRLKARDRAGNWGEAVTTTSRGGQNVSPNFQPPTPQQENPLAGQTPIQNTPTDIERKLINSKRISLNYELKDVGPSGVSLVELWFTLDGRSWNKYPLKFGDDPNQKYVAFDVAGEGLYGLSLVAKSGVGLGEQPPQIGDRPQIWVEVDTTKPLVRLHDVRVGNGLDKGKVFITWTAFDKNLSREPITLSYATDREGPWTPIVQNLPNTGRYVWSLPQQVPYQFYVRVEAHDGAGNIGSAYTSDLIRVDLSQPKVRIVTVEPATP